ncbi:MAG: bacterial Ig-like domain-containing protein [Alistipes sp.]|nr:bacterial Ig-like domain-containing protein [Alistipes sp.]
MRKILFVLTTAMILFASCAESGDQCIAPVVEATGDFTASFAETRTSLDGKAVVWNEEDCLTIFTKTSHNRKYQVKELSEDGRNATFGYVGFTGDDKTAIASNYAVYPYDAEATLSGGVITTKLAATQTYNAATSNADNALMAAKSESNNFSFVNAGALMRFNVSKIIPDERTLNAIKLTSAANNIAGEVTIDMGHDTYTAVVSANGVKEITLTDINTEITTETQSFYVAMPAVEFAKEDLTVTFVFAEGEKTFNLPAFSLAQGAIKTIAYQIKDAEDFTGSTPNDTIEPEAKRSVSILFVGNSLTQDGIAYLPYMLKNYYPEVDFKIYMWYIGGKTLGDHYANFTSSGKADIFSVAENSESWTNYSNSKTMASVLSTYTFDVVCMQEYFNYKSSYENCDDWNNCRNYILKNYKGGNALKFISLFHAPLRKEGYDVHEVYKRTEMGNALILQTTISEDIIPMGIAVYRALDTELNTLGDYGQLSNDGTHTQEGLPCLLQTYVTMCWLFDRYDINKSIYGHPLRITKDIYNKISVPGANLGKGVVTGTDAQYLLAQEIAIQAYKEGQRLLTSNLHREFSIATNVKDATIKINGTEQSYAMIPQGSTVEWEVSKDGYHTQSGSEVVESDITKYVELLPVIKVESLVAEFTQGKRTIFEGDELDDLKKYLVVTADYTDGRRVVAEDYTLSGVLTGGTSAVTVSFDGATTTFDVAVTDVVIPEGYTRYGWVATKSDTKPSSKHRDNFIYLNAYEDMNLLSSEFILGVKPGIKASAQADPAVCGARHASGDGKPWYAVYMVSSTSTATNPHMIHVDLRKERAYLEYPSNRNKFKLVIDNPATSPYTVSTNNGETTVSKEWLNTIEIPYGMSLFNNIPHETDKAMSFNYTTRIGEIKFRDYDGVCVGYYIPVTYNGKIGMYDVVTGTFCTAVTESAVTVSNSGCLYKVGNW